MNQGLGAAAWLSLGTQGASAGDLEEVYFSGGNFRFIQPIFDEIAYLGVKQTTVGFIDGEIPAVLVRFDPSKISYKRLLGSFWRGVDPTDPNGQFSDRGENFKTIIWTSSSDQQTAAEESKRLITKSGVFGKGATLATEIRDLGTRTFTEAPPEEQKWYRVDKKAFDKAREKTGRKKWFAKTYDPVTTTACEGSVCGYVYFPCSDENGCMAVMNGSW